MKRLKRLSFASLFLLLVLITTTPVFAAANPDSIAIYSAKAFENIFEDDDMLFVIRYDIAYASEPDEDAAYTFQMQLFDSDDDLVSSRALNYYQMNTHSIYLTAAQVTSANITYEEVCSVIVSGVPMYFPTLTEDVNKDTKALSTSDWLTDGTLTAKELLRLHCIDIAEELENNWSITLLTTTTEGKQVLNSTGKVVFLDAIPGLGSTLPDLFQTSSSTISQTQYTPTGDYADESTVENRLGSTISDAFEGIGDFFGVSEQIAAGLWLMLFILTVASIVFLNSGNSIGAMVLAIPIVLMGMYVGAIPMWLVYTVAILIVVYCVYFFILRGT